MWRIKKHVQNNTTMHHPAVNLNPQKRSLHLATRSVLFASRLVGLFPVTGLLSSAEQLRFKPKAPYAIFCVISVMAQTFLTILNCLYVYKKGMTLRNAYKLIAQASGMVCSLNIIFLAKKWPEVVRKATLTEYSLLKRSHRNIIPLCKFIAALLFCGAFVDLALAVNFYLRIADVCFDGNSLAESYYKYTMPAAAAVISFSPWSFYPMMVFYIQTVFVTQFSDVIIVVVSIYLSSHFEDLYELTAYYKDKFPNMWNALRVQHCNLIRLVKLIDDSICPFVMFSFGSNLTLICVQLYKILNKANSHAFTDKCDKEKFEQMLASSDRAAYFISSELLIVCRTLASALFASKVHLASKKPMTVLYDVPSQSYNAETRRFMDQIMSTKVALSGYHFFYVTRGMIMTMTAAVITYELVLLQFA